ncbi:MAG: PEP-CTERM sorting domain-containing protein [Verrucomicrobiae bacterium]|nr:PEP-CTERM sorting domain-containing protein [Verrucomicrobiae bacterium]
MKTSLLRAAAATFAGLAASLGAHAFPNIVSVIERNGDTDRPSAKATGMTFSIENPTGNVLIPDYTVGPFLDGAKSMTDRTHQYTRTSDSVGFPSYLMGHEYIMIANNNRDNANFELEITLANPSIVYLLIDNRLGDGSNANPPTFTERMQWVPNELWIPISVNGNNAGNPAFPDTVGIDESADGSINQWSSVYAKLFPAGTLTLQEYGQDGQNMYGVVVASIPEPGPVTLLLLGGGLYALTRRHRR